MNSCPAHSATHHSEHQLSFDITAHNKTKILTQYVLLRMITDNLSHFTYCSPIYIYTNEHVKFTGIFRPASFTHSLQQNHYVQAKHNIRRYKNFTMPKLHYISKVKHNQGMTFVKITGIFRPASFTFIY